MKIYVGNLSFSTTDDALSAAFAEFGSVSEVSIVTDRETGRPRGFAFVSMGNDTEARKAIEQLDGRDLDGRAISVSEARPKSPAGARGGSPNRGGGGGGGRRW